MIHLIEVAMLGSGWLEVRGGGRMVGKYENKNVAVLLAGWLALTIVVAVGPTTC